MIALIANIYSNLEALTSVMQDMESRSVDAVYCLGNIFGIGPSPVECFDMVRERCKVILQGKFEELLLYEAEFYPLTRIVRSYIHGELSNVSQYTREQCYERYDVIADLKKTIQIDGIWYNHPSVNVLYPKDLEDIERKKTILAALNPDEICFNKSFYTPPGVLMDSLQFFCANESNDRFALNSCPGRKIVNVGSVGYPCLGDIRATYLLFDKKENMVTWAFVPYNYEKTIEKVQKLEDAGILPKEMSSWLVHLYQNGVWEGKSF